jgi:hypothetical protein
VKRGIGGCAEQELAEAAIEHAEHHRHMQSVASAE